MEVGIALQERSHILDGSHVAEHRVDPVSQIPDPTGTSLACCVDGFLQCLHVVVRQLPNRYPASPEDLGGQLDRGMGLNVHQDDIVGVDQDRQGCQVAERGGRRQHHSCIEDTTEALLEFGIEAQRGVGRRRGEDGAKAFDGRDSALFQTRIGIETQVGAVPEVGQSLALDDNRVSGHHVILDPNADDPGFDSMTPRRLDQVQDALLPQTSLRHSHPFTIGQSERVISRPDATVAQRAAKAVVCRSAEGQIPCIGGDCPIRKPHM